MAKDNDSGAASRAKSTSRETKDSATQYAGADAELSLLSGVESPADVKALGPQQLPRLCREVREFLLDTVQRTGGHLGSNLGVVELTVALHRVFDFRRDRLVWDVSHQAYPHKVLTGRKDRFDTLRRTDGLCGFTHPDESPYDLFHTGHAGTSVSLGLGLAMGMAHQENPPHAVSVIGDASLGAGVAFEALNHAGATRQKLLVILNDNEWSISKSVGSLSKYLTKIRGSRLVQRAGQETKSLVQAIPLIGPRVDRALDDVGEVLRHVFVPGHVFEELGVRYVGPVDGHDVEGLVKTLERIRELDGVVMLHVLTEKGKGHPDGPSHPERVHAVKAAPKKASVGKLEPPAPQGAAEPKPVAFTNAFAEALIDAASRDVRVQAITAGMPSGTGLDLYAEQHPSRFHDVGICEQHGVAMAAGMAKAGMRPVCAIYSTFLQRGYDQVFQEVALQDLPVLFALDRAGPVGQDGPTHNGVFDIAYMRTFPNFVLGAPRDATDVKRMLQLLLKVDHPTAMRFPRGNAPLHEDVHASEREEMRVGKAEVLRDGVDGGVCIWAYGSMTETALRVAAAIQASHDTAVAVVDARFVKPLDEELLAKHLRRYKAIVTLEDHQRAGGFGSAVLEAASRAPGASDGRMAQVKLLGIPDRYVDHMTTREEQLASVGLDPAGVERTVRQLQSGQSAAEIR
ncbi:1-deoxy-D-xylulose-5-phosphate synthase [Planctomycetes bacterium Poly30]|uniref:1-deoxy-D-xylulose-5-phosphate synthase n=1 Tax=Saltatorellus ferox TaxID=2528018 RepID=A0A518ETM9_9BACT|nr:1-deoxy-D-xylulose-5-phosphate synthase [Planctomycetes bacterium Poly30]